ncbi:MAG: thioredoxin family protein [Candidatus Saganbacteria bacterium]|nr:thioredoxin family protein [Candidatus Saganbacteria bacterium]
MLEIKVFGKPGCEFCKTTMKKFETFLSRWKIDKENVSLTFFDMETMDGMAEGAFYSVTKIPSTVIEKEGDMLDRWHGKVPLSEEFKTHFEQLVNTPG